MERLEAALEKARERRREAGIDDISMPRPASKSRRAAVDWSEIPEIKISNRIARSSRLTALTGGPQAGPYDMLRSRALHSMAAHGWKRLAITSPTVGCGKTTVAANLAISMSRQPDVRIMLFDFDLRRTSLHKVIGHRPQTTLDQLIRGSVEPRDHLMRIGDNLLVGLNSKPADNPSELLQSQRMVDFIAEIERVFQPSLIIFDMPPMLVSDDNVGFMKNADCGLLVGAADDTTLTQLDLCEKELSDLTNVLGIVLNKCKYSDASTGYEYEYEYE